MKKKITINVTAKDIKTWQDKLRKNPDAQLDSCENCAVAKAIRRHKGLESIIVSYHKIWLDLVWSPLPKSVIEQNKIRAIDTLAEVAPFKFKLEIEAR